jgi:hypothetical protein
MLATTKMEVRGRFNVGEESLVPTGYGAEGSTEPVWIRQGEEKKLTEKPHFIVLKNVRYFKIL